MDGRTETATAQQVSVRSRLDPQPWLLARPAAALFPRPTHREPGAQNRWGSRCWSSGGDPGDGEPRPDFVRLLEEPAGRSGGCAQEGGAGGSWRWPACCALLPRPQPRVEPEHQLPAPPSQSAALPGELGCAAGASDARTVSWRSAPLTRPAGAGDPGLGRHDPRRRFPLQAGPRERPASA